MRAHFGRKMLAATLLSAVLAGCGQLSPVTQVPTAQPTVPTAAPVQTVQPGAPTAAPAHTAQPGAPTAAPAQTAQPGAPTAAPAAKPTFSFEPRGGAPGTVVTVKGWGFQPNSWVGVFIGIPNPVGTALGGANADAAGRWQAQVTIPGNLPDGSPVPAQNISLVTMNDQFRPQASAPFAYQAPAKPAPQLPPLAQARDNIQTLLAAYGTADIKPYLASTLRRAYEQGRPLPELLGFDPLKMQGKPDVGQPRQTSTGILAVETGVSVRLPGELRVYNFTLAAEDGFWKVSGAQLLRSEPIHAPFPGEGWTAQIEGDYTGDGFPEGYYVRPEMPAVQVGFDDPYLNHNSRPTTAVLIGQNGPHNPNVMLSADGEGVRVGDVLIATFSERAAGYLVAFDRRGPIMVHLYPLRRDGSALDAPVVMTWDSGIRAFVRYVPPVDQTPASEPGRQDAVAIGQLALDYLRPARPGKAIVVGTVATSGDYALAIAQPVGEAAQYMYLKRQGGPWDIILVTGGTMPDVLRSYGIPQSLEMPQPMIDIMQGTLAAFSNPTGQTADGYVLMERVDGRHARVTVRDSSQGDITAYLYQSMGWELLIAGQVFAPEELDRLGIPASVRQ